MHCSIPAVVDRFPSISAFCCDGSKSRLVCERTDVFVLESSFLVDLPLHRESTGIVITMSEEIKYTL